MAHTYSAAGTYHVKVSNNITSFAPNASNSTWCITTSHNRYTFKTIAKTGSRLTSYSAMPAYAFYYCNALSSIDWLSGCYTGVTAIPSNAFQYCTSITSLSSLPSRIKSLGSYAFANCTSLTGIQDLRNTALTGLTNYQTFYYCSGVKEWKLPSTLTAAYFGQYLFGYNSTLSVIELPSVLTSLPSYCFHYDTQLKQISIPKKVTTINSYAF